MRPRRPARRRVGGGDRRPKARRLGGEIGLRTTPRPARAAVARRASSLRATRGRGQVTLDWDAVDGAAGYLVRRADRPDGPFDAARDRRAVGAPRAAPAALRHAGPPGRAAWYTVAAVAAVDDHGQPQSAPVVATPRPDGDASCRIVVDAGRPLGPLARPWRPMIGAERLSQLEHGVGPAGGPSARSSPRRCAWPTTSSASRPCAPTPSSTTTSACTRGRRPPDPRLQRRRPDLRPRARTRPAADRRAELHATRPRQGPDADGVPLRRHHLAAQGLGPLGVAGR